MNNQTEGDKIVSRIEAINMNTYDIILKNDKNNNIIKTEITNDDKNEFKCDCCSDKQEYLYWVNDKSCGNYLCVPFIKEYGNYCNKDFNENKCIQYMDI